MNQYTCKQINLLCKVQDVSIVTQQGGVHDQPDAGFVLNMLVHVLKKYSSNVGSGNDKCFTEYVNVIWLQEPEKLLFWGNGWHSKSYKQFKKSLRGTTCRYKHR